MIVVWVVAILFLILSVVLLSGHGGFLIAGYNTSSQDKKSCYDEKKICRVTGVGMLFITMLLFIMAVLDDNMPDWFGAFFVLATMIDSIVMMVIANTKCYAVNPDGSRVTLSQISLSEEDIKRNKKMTKWSLIFTAATFILAGILLITGDINFQYGENEMVIEASYYPDMIITYDEIEKIEYREGYLKGSRTGGFGSFRLTMGGFENKEFGSYTRYTYENCHAYIVLTLEGKENPVIIAAKDKEGTEELYMKLQEKSGQ